MKKAPARKTTKTTVKKTAAKAAKPVADQAQIEAADKKLAAEAEDGAKIQEAISREAKTEKPAAAAKAAKPAADKAQIEAADKKLAAEAEDGAKIQEAISREAETEKPAAAAKAAKPAADKAQIEAADKKLAAEAQDGAKIQEAINEQARTVKPAKAAKAAKPAADKAEIEAADKKLAAEAEDGAKIQEAINEQARTIKPAPARKKAAARKTAVKPEIPEAEKKASYDAFDLYTLVEMAKAMGVDMNLEDYRNLLMKEADEEKILADILEKFPEAAKDQDFEANGYDLTLLPVVIAKAAEGMDVKASDFKSISNQIAEALSMELTDDGMHNADVYNTLFDLIRRLLVMGQNKGISSFAQLNETIPADLPAVLNKFMDVAYAVLPTWQYKDVKYYEGFIYAVLSQFEDLYDNRAMMDVADLLIRHGDYGLGDANYNYILRENQLKDQIYFRFANVYRNIDLNKAKAIANSALQFVDGRYDYYPRIIEILES